MITGRIAVAGAHATGKSTLAAELARALPGYRVIEEPYHQLESEGYVFAASPTLEDFEAQLERSLRDVHDERGPVIFDRTPADFVGYLLAHRDRARASVGERLPAVREAISTLDLVVFVPIERPDRIASPEKSGLRRRVDALLREGLVDDGWGIGATVMEARGTMTDRVAQVVARLATLPRAGGDHARA